MDKLQRRRKVRAEYTDKNRHARFISEYVKARHNHVYMEADQFFRDIRERNPHKKDMCKTEEFLKITTQYTSYAHFYKRRKTTPKKPENKDNMVRNIAPKKPKNMDNMLLNITLMSCEETSTKNQDETPLPAIPELETQDEIPPPAIPELETQDEIPPPAIPELETQDETPQLVIPELETQDETPQLVIPEHVYKELLQELRNDPDLYRIFNDMDIPDNENQQTDTTVDNDDMNIPDNESQQTDTTVSNDDMWDVFNIFNEQTPLERELLRLGFN